MKNLPVLFVFVFLMGARPFSVDDAGTVDAGRYEFEWGVEGWSGYASSSFSFKHGLTERMDLGFDFSYALYPFDSRSFSDVNIGMKYSLGNIYAFSFSHSLGKKDFSLNFITSPEVHGFMLNLNGGLNFSSGKDGNPTGGILIIKEMGNMLLGVELCSEYSERSSMQAGVVYVIRDGLQVDMGISSTLSKDPEPVATAGLHYEF